MGVTAASATSAGFTRCVPGRIAVAGKVDAACREAVMGNEGAVGGELVTGNDDEAGGELVTAAKRVLGLLFADPLLRSNDAAAAIPTSTIKRPIPPMTKRRGGTFPARSPEVPAGRGSLASTLSEAKRSCRASCPASDAVSFAVSCASSRSSLVSCGALPNDPNAPAATCLTR